MPDWVFRKKRPIALVLIECFQSDTSLAHEAYVSYWNLVVAHWYTR